MMGLGRQLILSLMKCNHKSRQNCQKQSVLITKNLEIDVAHQCEKDLFTNIPKLQVNTA